MCAFVLREPGAVLDQWNTISFMYDYIYACVRHVEVIRHNQYQEINSFGDMSPNAPLVRQVFEDKVLDMLLFLTLRYMKQSDIARNKSIDDDLMISMEQHDAGK